MTEFYFNLVRRGESDTHLDFNDLTTDLSN